MSSPPNLTDPEERAAYRRELKRVYRGWRFLGLAIVIAGIIWLLVRGDGFDSVSIGLLAIGWAILAAVVVMRTRYHQRRMRGDYQV
jgi:drug/metabolite transporter (DMT)-like permease